VDDVSAALGTRADEGGAGRRPVERVLVGHRGAIDRELAPLHAGVERHIVDAYRDLLYAR